MKIIQVSFLFLCLCILHGYAQDNELYQSIQQSKSSGEKFEPVAALAPASKSALQNRRVEEHFINPQEVYFLHYSRLAAKNLNASIKIITLKSKAI